MTVATDQLISTEDGRQRDAMGGRLLLSSCESQLVSYCLDIVTAFSAV